MPCATNSAVIFSVYILLLQLNLKHMKQILHLVPFENMILSPFTICSKLTFLGCSGRWLPTISIFSYMNSHLNYHIHTFLLRRFSFQPYGGTNWNNFQQRVEIMLQYHNVKDGLGQIKTINKIDFPTFFVKHFTEKCITDAKQIRTWWIYIA